MISAEESSRRLIHGLWRVENDAKQLLFLVIVLNGGPSYGIITLRFVNADRESRLHGQPLERKCVNTYFNYYYKNYTCKVCNPRRLRNRRDYMVTQVFNHQTGYEVYNSIIHLYTF